MAVAPVPPPLHFWGTARDGFAISHRDGLYQRWTALFGSLAGEQWNRHMAHPERGVLALVATLPMQVWHGIHHTAHIAGLRDRMNWR